MECSRAEPIAYLTQIYGESTNRKFKLMCSKVTIGRSFHAEIRLRNPNISRNHCTLFYSEKGWKITDNKSQNGTYISGRQLKPGETRPLQCGDIVFLGPPSEMPEAFCYDDAFYNDEDISIAENGYEIIEVLPAKCLTEKEITITKKRTLGEEISVTESRKPVSLLASSEHIKQTDTISQSRELPDFTKQNNEEELLQKCLNNIIDPFESPVLLFQQANIESHLSQVLPAGSPPFKLPKLKENDSGYQINEVSSTGDEQAEDSLSLLDEKKKDIVELPCPNSSEINKNPGNVQDAKSPTEIDLLKAKLALMAEQMRKVEESKLNLLKNYEVVCEKNFALDKQLEEKKKIEQNLKSCEVQVQDRIKNELLEKFEEDLICNICTELLIKPTVLDCSHTFCLFCIKEWKKKKNECPICRHKIQTMTPVLTLEHFIDKTLSTLTPEQKDRRNQLIKEREKPPPKKPPTPSRRHRYGRGRYSGRRHYNGGRHFHGGRQSLTSVNQQSTSSNTSETDVQIVGETRNNMLPIPLVPLTIPSMLLRLPELFLNRDRNNRFVF